MRASVRQNKTFNRFRIAELPSQLRWRRGRNVPPLPLASCSFVSALGVPAPSSLFAVDVLPTAMNQNKMEMENSIRYLIRQMQAFSKGHFAIDQTGQHRIVFRPARIGFGPWLVLLLALFSSPVIAASSGASTNDQQVATIKAQMDAAILRVQQIVNQPVTELRRTPDMQVATFGPGGWFHPGAIKPNFLTVDIRATQQFPYSQYPYVTSDLNPGVVFLGDEL